MTESRQKDFKGPFDSDWIDFITEWQHHTHRLIEYSIRIKLECDAKVLFIEKWSDMNND